MGWNAPGTSPGGQACLAAPGGQEEGTAEQLRILDKAPALACPAHEKSGCSPLSLQEIPFSPARGILMERWVLSLAISFNTKVSEAFQSLSVLGPWGKIWDSANQKDFLAPPGWSQHRHPAAHKVVGGGTISPRE